MTFSEQQLIDCDTDSTMCANGDHLASLGCTGGHVCSAMSYLADTGYLTEDAMYPYSGTDTSHGHSCEYREESSTYLKLQGYERHITSDVDEVKSLVAQQPITAAIAASSSAFQSYSEGIFDEDTCGENDVDHHVVIVGYGTDAISGKDYWLLKNSWGSGWGENGFMRLRILSEFDDLDSLKSSVATGGFCNVLQSAKYAPSYSERADHLKKPHARLTSGINACTAAGGATITWTGSVVKGVD